MRNTTPIILALLVCASVSAYAQRYENVKYGDFEHWTVRYIKESGIIGGKTATMYMVAPTDTIRENKPYYSRKSIWGSSNAYAVVSGITKVSCSVTPDKGPTGTCAKLETKMANVKVAGVINVNALAQGSLFWGRTLEPITGTKNPYAFIDWGIPFTNHPDALVLNIKSSIPNTGKIIRNNREVSGYDEAEILLILQYRWEDEDGKVHAKRVGTACCRIGKSEGWKQLRLPVLYGDISRTSSFKDYMGLKTGENSLYAVNSKGSKSVILEEGWADAGSPVTHAILSITSGSCGAFTGALGNTIWVDNVKFEYD